MRKRSENPERFYNRDLAIVPVAAFLAKYEAGQCWVIVCRWEYCGPSDSFPLGHFKVWALDSNSGKIIGFVSCD